MHQEREDLDIIFRKTTPECIERTEGTEKREYL